MTTIQQGQHGVTINLLRLQSHQVIQFAIRKLDWDSTEK
jgi:hypothetical protein